MRPQTHIVLDWQFRNPYDVKATLECVNPLLLLGEIKAKRNALWNKSSQFVLPTFLFHSVYVMGCHCPLSGVGVTYVWTVWPWRDAGTFFGIPQIQSQSPMCPFEKTSKRTHKKTGKPHSIVLHFTYCASQILYFYLFF